MIEVVVVAKRAADPHMKNRPSQNHAESRKGRIM
jgi:hypothetical protein